MKPKTVAALSTAAVLSLSLVFAGCQNVGAGGGDSSKQVTISSLGYRFENIDPNFWINPQTETAYVTFSLYLAETNLVSSDIGSITLEAQEYKETLSGSQISYDDSVRAVTAYRESSTSLHNLPLRPWTFTVTLTNGNSHSVWAEFAAPGASSADPSLSHVYTGDYTGDKTGKAAMVARAQISNATYTNGDLTVDFTVDDGFAYNAWLWLYDTNDNTVGSTMNQPAINWVSGAVNTAVIPTAGFNTDGTTTTFDIQADEVTFNSGYSLADVAGGSVVVVVTDGVQFQESNRYAFRSLSAAKTVN